MIKCKKLVFSTLVGMSVLTLVCGACGTNKETGTTESVQEEVQLPEQVYPVKIIYEEAGDDGEGNLLEVNKIVRTYTFDDKGNPVSCTKSENDMEIKDTYTNIYREDDSLEKVTASVGYYDEELGKPAYEDILREYDEEERLICKEYNGWIENYSYNPDGTMKTMEYYTEGQEASKSVLEYDYEENDDPDQPLLAKVKGLWYEDGQLENETEDRIISYNSDGYISKVEFAEADGIPYWEYEYEIEDGLVTKVSQHYEDSEYYTYQS